MNADDNIAQLRADMMASRLSIRQAIEALGNDGIDPQMTIEGALIAVLEASAKISCTGALVDWLRDAADHVEAFALGQIALPERKP
jgi:hypothetical protein